MVFIWMDEAIVNVWNLNFSPPQQSQNNLTTMLCNNHSQRQRKCRRREQCANMDAKCVLHECIHVCPLYIYTRMYYTYYVCILVYVYCIPARWKHAVCDQMHQMDQKAGSTARHQTPGSTRNTVFKSETFSSFLCIVNQEQQPPHVATFGKYFFQSKLFSLPWIQLSPLCGK